MRLAPIGQVKDGEQLDIEPITIPVCGVDREKGETVCEEFAFRSTLPWGNTFALIEAVEQNANTMAGNTIKWLRNCLISDKERERFQTFLISPTIEVEQSTIEGLYEALAEVYASRPTLPRTTSTGTGGQTEPTSKGSSAKPASTSKRRRSQTP